MQGIDLFSGAGGMSLGAEGCGISVRYAVESNQHAAQTFAANHKKTTLLQTDIRLLSIQNFSGIDKSQPLIIFGGPPCQGFSTSNQKTRTASNPSNWLFTEYMRIISEIRPEWVVFENVKGLVETARGFFYKKILKAFKTAGYKTTTFILNSAEYGVPQRRRRLFIIGSIHGLSVEPPPPTTITPITVRQAIHDLPLLKNGQDGGDMRYRRRPSAYASEMRGDLEQCGNHIVSNNSQHIIARYSKVPPGGNWKDIPPSLMDTYTDQTRCHTGIYKRLDPNSPSIVLGNFRKNMLIHPWQDRGLSVREAARLQSFPDRFRFIGSIGFQQQQVGNAVPPLLARAVFSRIVESSH